MELLNRINNILEKPIKIKPKNLFFRLFTSKNVTISLFNTIQSDKPLSDHTILHETQHYIDRCTKVDGIYKSNFLTQIWWYFKYTTPQILSLISLLSILSIWYSNLFLISLSSLIFLLPLPAFASFRYKIELRGYFWNYLFDVKLDYSKIFSGMLYYGMDDSNSSRHYKMEFDRMLCVNVYKDDDNMKDLFKIYSEYINI